MTEEELNKLDLRTNLIDDFLYTILLLKTSDCSNRSLHFLQSHIIELILKVTCDKLGLSYIHLKNQHDVLSIGRLLAEKIPDLNTIIPNDEIIKKYRETWALLEKKNHKVKFPFEMIDKYEMAFMVDNLVHLKYWFDKNGNPVSDIFIAHNDINRELAKLFNICRPIYTQRPVPKKILDLWQKIHKPYTGI